MADDIEVTLTDSLDEDGLITADSDEIQTELEDGYKEIYGNDIVLDSNSSDSQLINIFTQINTDIREMVTEVYNSFDPDKVRGQLQDVRYKLNGIERTGGDFTIVDITIVNTKTLSLEGLDSDYNDTDATAYGVSDDNGNQYYLIDSVEITSGTNILPFRCSVTGAENPTTGTLTSQISVIQGITSVNNPSAPTTIGVDQETDEAFALRREKSYEYRSQNSNDAMQSQILNLDGVSDAFVYGHDYDNYPDSDDADGIPLHFIWIIVEGGASDDIGSTIYANICGAGSMGAVEVDVPTSSGQTYVAKFDRNVSIDLYIRFDLQPTVDDYDYDEEGIKEYIAANLTYDTNEYAETSVITAICSDAILSKGGGGVAVNVEISLDGITWADYLESTNKKNKFTISDSNITITEV